MSAIEITQFDTARPIQQTLGLGGGTLEGGAAVKIRFYDILRRTQWEQDAEIVDEVLNIVRYYLVDSDVANAGDFEIQWGVVFPNTKPLTAPTGPRVQLTIWPAIIPDS
jgi:hypothetical protein